MAITAAMRTDVSQLYVALFGRAPDADGLGYWVQQLDAGTSLAQIAQDMYNTTPARAYYPLFYTNEEIVTAFYTNVLGNSPDADGLAYWAAQLGTKTQGEVIRDMIVATVNNPSTDAAVVTSKNLFNNKVTVGEYYAVTQLGDSTGATLAISGVTATTDVSSASAIASVIAGTATPPAATTIVLTTSVDAASGGAGNDTISGTIGASGTYNAGDNIMGGSGTDTLNLIDAGSATAVGVVSLDAVEVVNVRLVSAGTTIVNANDWSGVATLTNASSVAGSTLQVSGLELATDVTVYGNTDVNIGYVISTTAASAATLTLISVGNDSTATTLGSASAAATANIDLDLADGGLLTSVNVELQGTANIARLEAGSNVTTYTLSSTGNAILVTDDTVTSFDASAAAGNIDITFSGASDVSAVGGAGNDTFRFGATYSNLDSVNGGAGTDTITLTVAGFDRNLNATAVESATVTYSEAAGGNLNASASTVTAYTLAAGTAGNAGSISQIANASTITIADDDLGNVTLDYASGAASTTLNLGSATAAVAIGTLALTDVAAISIVAAAGSAGAAVTIGTATFDADTKSIAITTSGAEADLTIGTTNVDGSLGGATSLTVTSNGSASITFATVDIGGGTALANVTVSANGSDAADVTLGDVSGSAITTISLSGATGADVTVGTVDLGNNASAATQDTTLTIVQGQTSDVTVGAITVSGQGTLTLNVTQNGTAIADIAAITLIKVGTADAVAQNLTVAATTVAGSGEVAINNIDLTAAGTGAQLTFGDITVTQDGGFSAGVASATGAIDVDVSSITVTVGASASANFAGFLGFGGGAIGSRTITVAQAGSANFGAMTSGSAVGSHSIVANTGAGVDIGAMVATTGGTQTGGAVGAIEISGVDGADVTFGTIAGSALGAISVSGALDVTFGTITTTSVGTITNTSQGVSGNFTIDLSGVTNAVELNLGAATNTITSGGGNDVITLTSGSTANDVIRYTATGQGTDQITKFFAGTTGGDQIELATGISTATLMNADGEAVVNADAADLSAVITEAATALVSTDNVIVVGTAFATTAAMVAFVDDISLSTAAQASSTFVVAWTDGADTYVTLLDAIGGGSAAATTLASGGHTLSTTTLAVLQGVTPGALVAANFDFI